MTAAVQSPVVPAQSRIPGLSGVVITRNEEKRIRRCLDSIAHLCSEILVVDSGSTDATESICRSYDNVSFHTRPFDGFANQKNHALELATGPWLLCLDADESITEETAVAVHSFLAREDVQNGSTRLIGAKFLRSTFHMGRFIQHSGWNHYRYRLVKKGRVHWRGVSGFQLHELLYPVDHDWNKKLGIALPGTIIHYSQTDLSHQVDTLNTYSSIYAFARHRRGKRGYFLRMMTKPFVKFLEIYIFKLGFLDGYRGFIIAVSSSYASFLRWAKLYELRHTGMAAPSNLPDYLQE